MTSQANDIKEQIEIDRIDILYKRSKAASLALLAVSTIYTILLTKQIAWKWLLIWYLILLFVLCGRWFTYRKYFSPYRQNRSLFFWLNIFRAGVFSAGITIGSLNLFFFIEESLSFQLVSIIFPYGIAVGAVTMLLDRVAFSLYACTLLTPIIYQLAMAGEGLFSGTGALTIILGIFLLKFSIKYNESFLANTTLTYEKIALLKDLKEERNKLNNRLGQILNDSTTEIYVANADSLMCLQVNQGAVDNLGYSKDEFKNISLLDIFTDEDELSLREILTPLYKGSLEPVKYVGLNRRQDGSTFSIKASLQLSTADDPPIIVANVQDITEQLKWEDKLIYQANYDQLTSIFNRHYIQSYILSVLTRAKRHKKKVALLFLDLDNFKDINDSLGHDFGDEVLRKTADRISSHLRKNDIVARTGGDEFTVFLEDLKENSHAEIVARKLIKNFKKPFIINGQDIYTTLSIGISIYPDDADTHDQLMQCADMAMYRAKEDGRNTFHFFSQEMRRFSEDQMRISNQLRDALSRDEFSLVYQPKVDIRQNRIVGAEALLRWNNDVVGAISPNVFIPLAENLGLIHELGVWVLDKACQEASTWKDLGRADLSVAVNISPQQFRAGSLAKDVQRALTSSGLPCEQLELEITESLLMQDSDAPLQLLKDLSNRGIKIALDDFGTGYSSLSYVRRFPLQVLKIDRSFIYNLETDKNNKTLVDAIIAMAHSLGLGIVAEGVENESQIEYLREREVDIIQGFFFSPPVPAEKFRMLVQDDEFVTKAYCKVATPA